MMSLLKKKPIVVALISVFVSAFAYAEHSAPVYDVDSMSNVGSLADATPPSNNNASNMTTASPGITSPAISSAITTPVTTPISTIDQRVAHLEQQIENVQQNDLANRLNTMLSEVQSLRNQVEELTHKLQQLQTQQQAMYSDMDRRISNPISNPISNHNHQATNAPAKPSSTKASLTKASSSIEQTKAQPNVAEEQEVYQKAYDLIKAKKYNDAIEALQKMLLKYPSGQFAANAHYWLGELYGLTGENEQASSEFNAVLKDYPNSPRIADAQLKLGLIYATQLKWPEAKSSFKKVINKYPGTTSARLAMEQLRQIKLAGH